MPARGATVDLRDVWKRNPALRPLGVAAMVVLAAIVGNALYVQRSSSPPLDGGAASGPSPSATASPPGTATPSPAEESPVKVLIARPKILGQVPGGGVIVTNAFDRLEVLSLAGDLVLEHRVEGIAVGTPTFDGESRVAYWRRASLEEGQWALLVWDTRSDASRALLTLTTERPNGEIVWSSERDRLILAVRDQVGGSGRLLVVDPESGRTEDVLRRPAPPVPVYSDSRIIVAVDGRSYEVINVLDGGVITQAEIAHYGSIGASREAVLFGLVRTFEASAGPLRVWDAEQPGEIITSIPVPVDMPLFRPGHDELFFTVAADIRAVDYRSGSTITRIRASTTQGGRAVAIAFDETGRHLLVRDGRALLLYTADAAGFGLPTEVRVSLQSEAVPIGLLIRPN